MAKQNDSSEQPPVAPTNFDAFEAWKQYQTVAMHFNDLLMRLRSQSLAAVAGLSAVAAVVVKAGVDPAMQWIALAGAFLLLSVFWLAIWVLDFCYYNRLLAGAVDALIELESQSGSSGHVGRLVLSTRIEAVVADGKKFVTGQLGGSRARWFFYSIVFVSLVVGLLASAVKAGLFHGFQATGPTNAWFSSGTLNLAGPDSALSYSNDAWLGAEIPLPAVESVATRAKFVVPPSGGTSRLLGYVAEITVAPLDQKKIPAKYLEKRVEQSPAGPVTTMPLEQVIYSVIFNFDLVDRDGFILSRASGRQLFIRSGQKNVLQELAESGIDPGAAGRVVSVKPHLTILKCESCR